MGAMAAILLFQESEANVKESRAEKRDLELIVLWSFDPAAPEAPPTLRF